MIQTAGQTTADTKLDLVVNPWGMLDRSLGMWDRLGNFGQVGNQSYGYLWPMGPFFGLGETLAIPAWTIQRLWMALVLVVAFQGAARVARALGIRSDVALLLTGLAYALSPRLLTTVGPDLHRGVALGARAVGAAGPDPRIAPGQRAPVRGGSGARRRHGRRCERRRDLRGHPPRSGVAAHPRAGPPAAHPDAVVARRDAGGLRLVAGAAAAARPVQPAVPRLHRDRRRHHLHHHAVRLAARHHGLDPLPRLALAGGERPRHRTRPHRQHRGPGRPGRAGSLARPPGAPGLPLAGPPHRSGAGHRRAPGHLHRLVRRATCTPPSTARWRRSATCTSSTP